MKRMFAGVLGIALLAAPAVAQYAPGYGGFWRGAPSDPRERIEFLQHRIDRGIQDGSLDRHEARSALRDLDKVRSKARDLYRRDHGQLSGGHQEEIEHRLDDLSRRLRWDRRAY